jgi:hypothetical protein
MGLPILCIGDQPSGLAVGQDRSLSGKELVVVIPTAGLRMGSAPSSSAGDLNDPADLRLKAIQLPREIPNDGKVGGIPWRRHP